MPSITLCRTQSFDSEPSRHDLNTLDSKHQWFEARRNSIGFLRLALAFLVIFSHSFPLGGFGPEPLAVFSHHQTFGGIAVAGFFFLSGFLITQSYCKVSSIRRYLWHRALRIFPGFWTCLIFTAFVIGPIVCTVEGGSLGHYFDTRGAGPWQYAHVNFWLDMKQWGIANLFAHNPYPVAVDGSLWTLSNEFECYIVVAVLGLMGVLTRWRFLALALVVCLLLMYGIPGIEYHAEPFGLLALIFHPDLFLEQSVYFSVGMLSYLYRRRIVLHPAGFVFAAACVTFFLPSDAGHFVLPFALPYMLLWLAYNLPMSQLTKQRDYSYGIYIYAFPMQQLASSLGLNHLGFAPYVILSSALTIPLAMLSWHLVEQPCLRLKHLRFEAVTHY